MFVQTSEITGSCVSGSSQKRREFSKSSKQLVVFRSLMSHLSISKTSEFCFYLVNSLAVGHGS